VTTLTHQTVYAYDHNDRLNSEVTTDYTPVVALDLPADSLLARAKSTARWSTNGLIGFGAASLLAVRCKSLLTGMV